METNNKPHLVIVGGANGSGKSTFAEEYIKTQGHIYISADSIAAKLNPSHPTEKQFEAGREFFQQVKNAAEKKQNILIESTLSGLGLRKLIMGFRKNSYFISIFYIFVQSVENCHARVRERVLRGGHDIPLQDLLRRFPRSHKNFWKIYRLLADNWFVFNNDESMTKIIEGSQENYKIEHGDLFKLFLQFVEESKP